MPERLVSIVIPCFNAERYLEQALQSVVWQTRKDWECILVDDGSTDTSPAVFRRCAAGDARFRYERQENQGPAAARNRGVQLARGEFVQFLDADDILLPGKLDRSIERFRAERLCGVVYSDYACLGGRNEFFKTLPGNIPSPDAAREFLFGLNRTFVVPLHAFLFRKNVIVPHPFDVALHSFAEDMDCWIRIAASGVTFEFVPEVLVIYRLSTGTLAANESRIAEAKLAVLEKYGKEPWVLTYPAELKAARTYYQERRAIGYFMDRSFGQGWRILVSQWPASQWSSRLKMLTWFLLLLFLPKRMAINARAWAVTRLRLRVGGWSSFQLWEPPPAVRDLLISSDQT